MKNGFIDSISELFEELSKIEKLSNKISLSNEKIMIVFYEEFKLEIVFESKLSLFYIYINSLYCCEVEEQDVFEFIIEIMNKSIIIQNKKVNPFKKLFIILSKKSFDLQSWKEKRNIKIFTSDEILVDNF